MLHLTMVKVNKILTLVHINEKWSENKHFYNDLENNIYINDQYENAFSFYYRDIETTQWINK
jgi:hypothetical protein